MLPALIERRIRSATHNSQERGVTLLLVAVAMFSIIWMAGMSIDIGTLYQASAEAQRAADAAALAAARTISVSGITGDLNGLTDGAWAKICGGLGSPATLAAITVAQQNPVGGSAVPTTSIAVTYFAGKTGGPGSVDCSALDSNFGANPAVTVKVTQPSLPTYFSRVWGRTGNSVSATATAEAFNPSNSKSYTGEVVPVRPRCVKPWIVPNLDPGNLPGTCTGGGPGGCPKFVSYSDGSIQNPGIINNGTGVIGEKFDLAADCGASPGNCRGGGFTDPSVTPLGTLQYVPGQVLGSPVAAPSCGNANSYQQAIAGCDQSTPYQCGVPNAALASPNQVDFNENPLTAPFDTLTAAECLIHQTKGQDSLDIGSYPYQIKAGAGNPLNVSGSVITSSNSIVSLPIYDSTSALAITGNAANVTIVGFLQVFINFVNPDGSMNVTVLNVAGCGNAVPNGTPYLTGTSPVPVRLITPP